MFEVFICAYNPLHSFAGKDFKQFYSSIRFVSAKDAMNFKENEMGSTTLRLTDGLWSHNETSSVIILHPEHLEKCLEMRPEYKIENMQCWILIDDVSDVYYYGDNRTLVVCCIK